jgi:predicted DNA-binding transcriptional regulator AlpA
VREAIGAEDEPFERWWTVHDVSRRYTVPVSWVYQKAEAGELPSVKLSKYRRFIPQEVREWFAAQRSGA